MNPIKLLGLGHLTEASGILVSRTYWNRPSKVKEKWTHSIPIAKKKV